MINATSSYEKTENADSIEFRVVPSPMPVSIAFITMSVVVGAVFGMVWFGFGVGPAIGGIGIFMALIFGTRAIVNSFRKPYTLTVTRGGFVNCKGSQIEGESVTKIAIRNRYLKKGELPQIATHKIKVVYNPNSSVATTTASALVGVNAINNSIAVGFNNQTRAGAKANFELVSKNEKGKEILLATGLTDTVAIELMHEVSEATGKMWGTQTD